MIHEKGITAHVAGKGRSGSTVTHKDLISVAMQQSDLDLQRVRPRDVAGVERWGNGVR